MRPEFSWQPVRANDDGNPVTSVSAVLIKRGTYNAGQWDYANIERAVPSVLGRPQRPHPVQHQRFVSVDARMMA